METLKRHVTNGYKQESNKQFFVLTTLLVKIASLCVCLFVCLIVCLFLFVCLFVFCFQQFWQSHISYTAFLHFQTLKNKHNTSVQLYLNRISEPLEACSFDMYRNEWTGARAG